MDDPADVPPHFYQRRITDRAIQEMLGMAKGMVCDGEVTEEECKAFARWLTANPHVTSTWPGSVLAERILSVFEDGIVTKDERHELYELMCDTVGDGGNAQALAANFSTRLPFDDPVPTIRFDSPPFVFTGTFCFGTRAKCEAEVIQRGGKCWPRIVRQPLTLVIGRLATQAWIQSDYGRKIEKAVEYRSAGVGIQIVGEESWTRAFRTRPGTLQNHQLSDIKPA